MARAVKEGASGGVGTWVNAGRAVVPLAVAYGRRGFDHSMPVDAAPNQHVVQNKWKYLSLTCTGEWFA